jgi:hypothetical protein
VGIIPPSFFLKVCSSWTKIDSILRATKLPRSSPSPIQNRWSLGNLRRRPCSTSPPKRFTFPSHLLEGFVSRDSLEP